MGYGPVNAPSSGGSSEELEAVRKLAQGAADTADAAKNTADTAKATADTALEAANAARGVANTAKSTADQALALAGTAKDTADTAKATADQALETANTAKATADAAASAAAKAQQTADEAAQSIKDITNTISSTPSQNGSLVYNASVQSPTWNSYNPEQLTLGGVTEAPTPGSTRRPSPEGRVRLERRHPGRPDGTWTIKRKTVQLPAQSGSLTYTGSAQSPTWDNYSAVELDMGGATSGTNAGSYQATFTPTSNFQWSDGTYGAKNATWSIAKAAGSLSINPTTMTLDVSTSENHRGHQGRKRRDLRVGGQHGHRGGQPLRHHHHRHRQGQGHREDHGLRCRRYQPHRSGQRGLHRNRQPAQQNAGRQ